LRELRNAIERAVILAKELQILPEDLPTELRRQAHAEGDGAESLPVAGSLISLEQLEEAHMKKILERTPSLTEAAQILGVHVNYLHRLIRNLELKGILKDSLRDIPPRSLSGLSRGNA